MRPAPNQLMQSGIEQLPVEACKHGPLRLRWTASWIENRFLRLLCAMLLPIGFWQTSPHISAQPIANPLPPIPKGALSIRLQPVAEAMVSPLGLVAPDDGSGRLFVFDQSGVIAIISGGSLLASPLLDVKSRLVSLNAGYDERGLLGLALHPSFASNGKIYTYTSEPVGPLADFTVTLTQGGNFNHQSVVAEWVVDSANPNRVDPASRRELLRIDQPQSNHNGGAMVFGPDGMLYIALGDGGGADDQANGHGTDGNGQNIEVILGKIIRIDVAGSNAGNGRYGIPPTNPFVGKAGIDEIYAYGFRNPYTISIDLPTGNLYAGDVGQNAVEEIDRVVSGGNYGWNLKEGSFFFDPNGSSPGFITATPVKPVPSDVIDPIAQYDHDDGTAVICGSVYRGSLIPALQGRLVCGDLAGPLGRLFYLDSGDQLREFRLEPNDAPLGLFLKGLGQDALGELYVCASSNIGPSGTGGRVLKMLPGIAAAHHTWSQY